MYDQNSMMSQPVVGSQAQVEGITLDEVKAFYNANMIANLATVHVAGDIDQKTVINSLKPIANHWKKGSTTLPKSRPAKVNSTAKLYFVDVPGSKQSFIRIGERSMLANSADYYPAVAVNHNLGGGFSGQMFQILRLQKGYTYGAYSGFNRRNAGGVFTAQSSVRSNVTLESLQTFREIMFDYSKNFDADALSSTKSVLTKSNARAFETTDSLMGVLQNISSYGLSENYVAKQQQVLSDMTLEQAKAMLTKYVNPQTMIYLVVGDAATQLERVKELGLGEPILLDSQGEPVKKG
jgi:zinc protease